MKHKVIGIDLGTTYSAVAAYDDAEMTATIIRDETDIKGDTTPSVIGLDATTGLAIVGAVAKRNAAANPLETIIEIKREMGELFTDATLDKYRARRGVSQGRAFEKGDPVHVFFHGDWRRPQEMSALTLMHMAAIAQRSMGEEICDAVITVPAYFTANQKKATEDAAKLAGLYPRQLIPEPTAAAICYGVDTFDAEEKVYLVYDLGGGTFDVSIIKVKEGAVDVIATAGDARLGGGDFDDAIVYWAVEEAKKHGLDISANPQAKAILKLAAEETKILLSGAMSANIVVADPSTGRALPLVLEREKFQTLINGALQRSLASVGRALQYAKDKSVPPEALDAVLLVGGSTRVPHVRHLLLDYFNKDENFVRGEANPDHVVARGAAMVARKFEPSPPPFDLKRKPDAKLVSADLDGAPATDVRFITEHTLGVGVQDDRFDPLISRGTNIPVSEMKVYTNPEGATYVVAPIYQGEGSYVYENTPIGDLRIGPMQPLPSGHHQFEVTFTLDQNGLLNVVIFHKNENKTYTGDFRHKSVVEGDDALILLRQGLLAMFQPIAVDTVSPVPPQPAPPPEIVPPPQPAPPAEATTVTDGALPANLLTEIRIEIKEEFRSLVRRTQKLLMKKVDPGLVSAYNAFAEAANTGSDDDALTDLADQLEDAYSDARRAP